MKWDSRDAQDLIQVVAVGFMIIFVAGISLYVYFRDINKVAEKYTEREHWVMEEVLSKIKPECLKSSH
jgi:hypothetical protein